MGTKFLKIKSIRILFSVLILIVFLCIGTRMGRAFGEVYEKGSSVKWRNFGKPPGELNRILSCYDTFLWVETTDGQIYEKLFHWYSKDLEGWQKSSESDIITDYGEITNKCVSTFEGMRDPPKDTIHCCGTVREIHDGWGYINFALLSDGNVWVWEHSVTGLGPLSVYTLRFCGGTLIGLILGIVAIDYLRKKY